LINQAIHNLDLLIWMLGNPHSVCAYTANQRGLSSAEDLAVGIIQFKSGALGLIEASSGVFPRNLEESLAVFGEDGSAVITGTNADQIKTWIFKDGIRDDLTITDLRFRGHLEVYEDLVRALKTGSKLLVDGIEGRRSLALILALHQSAREKREVVVNQ
jgi:UDP-N-acetyl-2-amino-2-deoxyglucuronate dehydrogenase